MPEPKNLKVLKVAPSELIPLMRNYSASLGVQCVHCHVQGDFASDEKPTKETARTMITMTAEINGKYAEATLQHVGCYTCHRGNIHPETNPPAASASQEGPRPRPADAPPAPAAAPATPPPPQ